MTKYLREIKMYNLFDEVKRETFIFTDKQIKDKIKLLNDTNNHIRPINEIDVSFYLYKDKKILTKEEYTKEVVQYLYVNSFDSKDKINSIIEENKSWFYDQYNIAVNGKQPYFHAVQHTRSSLMGFLKPKGREPNPNDIDLEDD